MSARASLVCCPLISLTSPLAPSYLSEAALTTSLQASLLPGTPFLIDLSEPPASGRSPSRALLAAPFSSPPARALLPARHAPLRGVTVLLGTCHCSVPRVSVQRGRTPGARPLSMSARCLGSGAAQAVFAEPARRSCLAVVWDDLAFIVPAAATLPESGTPTRAQACLLWSQMCILICFSYSYWTPSPF